PRPAGTPSRRPIQLASRGRHTSIAMQDVSRPSMKLQGRVALITGGGGGMGGAQARLFAQQGAAVCAADLFLDKAASVSDEINAAGGRAIAAQLDVQRSDDWTAAVAAT